MKVQRQSWYRAIHGCSSKFWSHILSLSCQQSKFQEQTHKYYSVASLRAIFQAIQGAKFAFSGKRLYRNLSGLVAAARRGAVFNTTRSSVTEFIRYLQSEQQEAFHNMHSPWCGIMELSFIPIPVQIEVKELDTRSN